MSELVTFGETPLQFSPPGKERLETARETTLYPDGTESNAAVAANQLGTNSTWVSKLPATALSRRVVGELERYGIETSITWASQQAGRQGLVFREAGQPPRDPQRWHDRDNTATVTAEPSDLPMETIQTSDVVFSGISTASLAVEARAPVKAMLRAAYGSGPTTALDIDYQAGLRPASDVRETLMILIDHLDILIANEDNIQTVLDMTGKPRELANRIATEHDLETVVITRNDDGAVVMQNTPGTNIIHEKDSIETDAVDSAGKDAAFSGGFLARIADGADLEEALSYGIAAATLVQTVPGPFLTADRAEIKRVAEDVV